MDIEKKLLRTENELYLINKYLEGYQGDQYLDSSNPDEIKYIKSTLQDIQRTLDLLKSKFVPQEKELSINGIEEITVSAWFKSLLKNTQFRDTANIYYNSKDSILHPKSNVLLNTSLLEECIQALCSFAIERSHDRATIQLFSKTTDTELMIAVRDYGNPISAEMKDWLNSKTLSEPPSTPYKSFKYLERVLKKLARNDRYPVLNRDLDAYNEIEIGIPYLKEMKK